MESRSTYLWTGSDAHLDEPLIVAATLPMILTPVAVLIHNILVSHQAPLMPAVARGVQLLLTLVAYSAASVLDAPLRMMVALSIGQIFGFAPVAYLAAAQLIPGLALSFHLRSRRAGGGRHDDRRAGDSFPAKARTARGKPRTRLDVRGHRRSPGAGRPPGRS